ncbi:histidinol dehydrogenase [Helicobacter trogontum]|uniref:Histidinol dehydrogenase n=1 Tax=Helicobacter trogontum TaxID=50960 RepID=A0A4U8TB43_9HELI|nr:histidinol dehydrogenase [Helicobacter trogontum]MCI5786622.1 histidinol dehydrogenase [Helicobacter trogontum]MDY5184633.1 histidinol dehydrogenase [Helicobacter trogontum]TLD97130.1 histidinol dehydrogenase [Helicobacter trogontum]
MIKILDIHEKDFETQFNILLERANIDMDNIIPQVLQTLQDIKQRGEAALLDIVKKYDDWNPKTFDDLKITEEDTLSAYKNLDPKTKDALQIAYDRIYTFHAKNAPKGFIYHDEYANMLGQNIMPVERAGIYIPGGKAFYPSSLLMNAIPAKVAGVREIIMASPTPHNHINELVLAAMYLCGIKEGYKIGGIGAIGMFAYGFGDTKWSKDSLFSDTQTTSKGFKKVDVITGPGNIYVATAKKLVFGEVNIDMIAGPSEIGIIADSHANSDHLAIDMLSQAEHDAMASAILITDDRKLAYEVAQKIDVKLTNLARKAIAQKSIQERGAIIIVENLKQTISLMNAIAPEHLEIVTKEPFLLLGEIKTAGAVFLGHYTPEAIGDYLAGPNHTLPTGGSARFFSPLGVEHFCTRSSLISFSKQGIAKLATPCATLAEMEGLEAHKLSVLSRLNSTEK